MPCTIDTSEYDERWHAEVVRHHEAVESILEQVIETGETSWAAAKLEDERKEFANNFRKIFKGLYNAQALEERAEALLNGKRE